MNTDKIEKAFPDFDVTTLPAIPDGFVDDSWGNDACPSFVDHKRDLLIFIDYADPADREMPDTPRFSLLALEDGQMTDGDDLASSDDWTAILAAIDEHTSKKGQPQ